MAPKDGDQDSGKKGAKDEGEDKGRRKSAYKLPEPEAAKAAGSSTADDDEGAEVIALTTGKSESGGITGLFDNKLGDAVKQSFRSYVLENVVPEGQKSGAVDLNVDVDFVKQHGASLLSAIFNSVTKAVVPEKLELTVPVPVPEEKGAAPVGKDGKEPEVKVNVNMDVIKFIKGLLAPRPTEATAAPAATTGPTLVPKDEDEGDN